MIISEAKDLIWNGTPALMAIYNGEKVWPKKTATAYRVWIEWDPVKSENVCIDGLYWDNLSMVNSDIVTHNPTITAGKYLIMKEGELV